MRCENCVEKGYIYCFHYAHSIPVVRITSHKRMVEITEYQVEGVKGYERIQEGQYRA